MEISFSSLIKPFVTEKSSILNSENSQVSIVVHRRTNKIQVKNFFFNNFGITPKRINSINVKPKKKRLGKHIGRTKEYKKVIISLSSSDKAKIDHFTSL